MRAGSLGNAAIERRRERLVAGHAGVRERPVGLLLEDLAEPLQRDAGLTLEPGASAEPFLDPVPLDAWLRPCGDGHLGRSVVVDQLPLGESGRAAPAADPRALDDPARRLDLDDLVLGAHRKHRRVDHERGARADTNRVDAVEPVVSQEVVHPGDSVRDVEQELEDRLARSGDDYALLDRSHRRGILGSGGARYDCEPERRCANALAPHRLLGLNLGAQRAECAPGLVDVQGFSRQQAALAGRAARRLVTAVQALELELGGDVHVREAHESRIRARCELPFRSLSPARQARLTMRHSSNPFGVQKLKFAGLYLSLGWQLVKIVTTSEEGFCWKPLQLGPWRGPAHSDARTAASRSRYTNSTRCPGARSAGAASSSGRRCS